MPPKKRAATATKPTAPGKAKRQKVSKASHERKEAAVDLSAQNAIQSPLFRLPAELRDVIWRLIFGEMVIEVTSKHNAQPDHAPEMKYRLLKDVSDTQRHGTKRAFGPQLVCAKSEDELGAAWHNVAAE
ncbi:hypothetical protein SLS59_009314 [Nothophoma quercina]|uniref:Uncharacterized protein n=1 Tax=Nothophoma quercina TaxID=749835 RepID=A0ABR3QMP9_9PLEO